MVSNPQAGNSANCLAQGTGANWNTLVVVPVDESGNPTAGPSTKTAEHVHELVAFGSLTDTSFALLVENSDPIRALFVLNSTDRTVTLSMDAGTTAHYSLPPGGAMGVDYGANGLIGPSADIDYLVDSAPTRGSLSVTILV